MRPSQLMVPRGRDFIRSLIARAVAAPAQAAGYADSRWGAGSRVALELKAAVGGLVDADLAGMGRAQAEEFFGAVLEQTIIGRLQGLRRVPLLVRLINVASGARGYWVGQHKPIPLSKPDVIGATMTALKVAAIICATRETLETRGDVAETRLQADITRALVELLDATFIDADNAGIADDMPAAVTNGVSPITSSGNPADDLAALIEAFAGDLSAAYLVTDPLTATQIALARDAGGSFAFPDAGPRGGSAIGIPLLSSRGSPRTTSGGQLALVDPTGIAFGADSIDLTTAGHTSLLMSDDPENEPATMVGLFQTDTVALQGVIAANWQRQRAGSVAVITSANYPTAAS